MVMMEEFLGPVDMWERIVVSIRNTVAGFLGGGEGVGGGTW